MRYNVLKRQPTITKACQFLVVVCVLALSASIALAIDGRIAFTVERDGEEAIYVMDGDGENPSKLAEGSYPAWLPDGQSISFLYEGDLWMTKLDGTNRQNLTLGRFRLVSYDDIAWSPDGRQIAYWGFSAQGPGAYITDADGRNAQLLVVEFSRDGSVSWAPYGNRITFSAMRPLPAPFTGHGSDIFVMNADGRNRLNLTDNPTSRNVNPSWSPDGVKIAYVASPDPFRWWAPHNIYVMNADGTNPVILTKEDRWAYESNPTWSPDSRRIAFAKQTPDGFKDIFSINVDGSDLKNLTQTHRVEEEYPAWSPGAQSVSSSGRLVTQWGAVKHRGD